MKKRKYALVLSGGGFKAAFQLGAINYLNEHWQRITGLESPMEFDIIAGISGGSLNGSFIAMNKLNLLNDIWLEQVARNGASEIYTSEFIDTANSTDKLKWKLNLKQIAKRLIPQIDLKLNLFSKLGLIFSEARRKEMIDQLLSKVEENLKVSLPAFKAIADNTPLKRKLEKYLDRKEIVKSKFLCGFVSLDSGLYHGVLHNQFSSNEDFTNGILASTSVPMVWSPVPEIKFESAEGQVISLNNVDGGVRDVSPLGDVVRLINQDPEDCTYTVIIINSHNGIPTPGNYDRKSIGAIAARSIYEITLTEVFNNDIEHFLKINDLVKQAKDNYFPVTLSSNGTTLKSFDTITINPEKDLGNPLVANKQLILDRYDHGVRMANKVFNSNG